MADKQVQIRKGTTAANDAFTGVIAEMSYDTQEKRMRIHDGITVGGFRLALKSEVDTKEPLLGFTPENVANKATDFSVVNNTLYPSVQAAKTYADTKQPALGFTPENVANKATDFSIVNNTLYPSVQAAKTYADTKQPLLGFTPENVANKATDFSVLNNTLYPTTQAVSNFVASSVAVVTPPFVDTQTIIKGSADATKLLRFEVDGFTTATTRVLTPPNADATIAGLEVAQIFTAKQTITPPVNTEALVVSGYSLTGANTQSLLDLTGTWNTSGDVTGLKLTITNTASGANSRLAVFDYSALGTTTKPGLQLVNNTPAAVGLQQYSPALRFTAQGWKLNATAASQPVEFRMYTQSILGAANPTGNLVFEGSINNGAWTSLYTVNFTGAAAVFTFTGNINTSGNVTVPSTGQFRFGTPSARSIIASSADGLIELFNTATTGFTRLNFGGTTSSFPAITRSGAAFIFNLGDGTGSAAITSGNYTMTVAARLSITSGTNQRAGNAVLVAGTVTVNNTTVTANTLVLLTRKTSGGTPGTLITYTLSAGNSFTINSDSALDTSTFSYFLIEVP